MVWRKGMEMAAEINGMRVVPGSLPGMRDVLAKAGLRRGEKEATILPEPRARRVVNLRLSHPASFGQELVQPDPNLMSQISNESGQRVKGFLPPEYSYRDSSLDGLRKKGGVEKVEYEQTVAGPLHHFVWLTFPGRELAIHSTWASINGQREVQIAGEERSVSDVVKMAEEGIADTERIENNFKIGKINPDGRVAGSEENKGQSAITAVAGRIAFHCANLDKKDQDLALFPVILAYDWRSLQITSELPEAEYVTAQPGHSIFEARFREGVEPSEALLGVFVAGYIAPGRSF